MRILGGHGHSGYTQKVRIALAEKGLTARIPIVHLTPEERRGSEHRKRNPLGLIPVLELDDGSFLPESSAIIEYLDALFPDPSLIPSDPLRRARMHVFDHYNDQALTPAVRRLWDALFEVRPTEPDRAAAAAAARADISAVFTHLDGVLGDGAYLVGDFSLADIAFMARLQVLPELGVDIPATSSRARAWQRRLQERASWSATAYPPLPERVLR
jgi:glutathione S-transferase